MYKILGLLLLLSVSVEAQHAVIREVVRPMTTYPYSDPDPVARPGRVYPYFRFDGFTNESKIQNWKMVELENDYIRLAIMPEMGGKVWEAYEKSQEYPFVFTTHVVKFRDIALRGAWTTGGLEFNFGDIGHGTTVSTPVDYFTRTNSDESVSCFIGATDWASRTTWRVEIKLSPDKAYFTTRSWWYNNTPVEQEFYHWVNTGFKAAGNLELVFPGTHHIGHGGKSDTWPLDSMGRKISFYKHNNFGTYKSYHILGRPTAFYGAYWHDDNMGFGHYSPYYEKLGKKAWILGLSQEGTRWENLLGDSDGLNVELQSGRLFNQASRGSEFTPFKHVGFAPYSADSWDDHWFPVRQTRGMTNASLRGALNIRTENGWLKIDWMSLENQSDTFNVMASGSSILKRKLSLKPMELYRDSIEWNGSIDQLVVKLGHNVLTDDPGANYFWAISSQQTGHESDAQDGFSVATLSPAFRQAAWLRIAGLSVKRRDWNEAAKVLTKCLDSYPPNEMAWNLKAITDRKQGNTVSAISSIEKQLEFNPLNHLARFEKYLNTRTDEDKNQFVGLIRQELPHETYIEMALQYWEWSMEDEALIYWQYNQPERAKALFNDIGNEPDFIPYYLVRAELFQGESEVVRASLKEAYRLDMYNWRSALRLTRFYESEKELGSALDIALVNYNAHKGSFVVGLQYAKMLKLNGKYSDALAILNQLVMLPAEGDVNAHSLFRETNILYAIEKMKERKWKRAIVSLKNVETWPENLFSGEPYLADNRLTQFLAAYCFEKLKIKSRTDEAFDYLITYSNPYGRTSPFGNSITRLVKKGNRDFRAITETLLKEPVKDKDVSVLTQFMNIL